MKGRKYFILLLFLSAWAGVRADSLSEAEADPFADPDYIYVPGDKKSDVYRVKNKQKGTATEETATPTKEFPTVEIIEKEPEVCNLPVEKVEPKVTVNQEKKISDTTITSENGSGKVEEFKREIESVDFVPKGQWIFGLSVSYTQSSQDKYQFLILEGITGDTYSFKISPMVLFAIKADWALGGRFSYARSLTKVANAELVLDSETDYSFDHLYRLSHNYYGAILMRNYFSIGKSKRFGFFNEVALQMGGGQTKLTTGVGDDLTGTYERNFSLNVGITPGICVFLSNYSALEVNVGLLGFNYTDTRAVKDQIYVSRRNAKLANFRINLFSITFGATFYL